MPLAKCSQDIAARDIEDLSGKGILARDLAGGRSTRYSLITNAADAVEAAARWVMAQHADKAAQDGPGWLGPEKDRARMRRFQAIDREQQGLAQEPNATPSDADFETRLRAWHDLGLSRTSA